MEPMHRMPDTNRIRANLPALLVLLLGCLASVAVFQLEQRLAAERIALHAATDAAQYQHTLEQGIGAYVHLSRDLAGYIAAVGAPSERGFAIYARTADVLAQHPGLGYVGYVERVASAAGSGKADRFPYRYAYPLDASALRARGLDFSAVPERWSAMQQARDTGRPTGTAKHFYLTDARRTPIVAIFSPIYGTAEAPATVPERRVALSGFVFSIFEIERTVECVMGPGFRQLFDLEIYDGPVRPENMLYDGDKRPHRQLSDRDFPVARRADITFANRTWTLFFFAKPVYAERYRNPYGVEILLAGFAASGGLFFLTAAWMRRVRLRSRQRAEVLRFDTVFEKHPFAVYSLDRQRRFVSANPKALSDFKYDKEKLIGKRVEELIVPENRARSLALLEQVLNGDSVSYESALIDGNGARVEVSVILLPIMANDDVVSVLGVAENITERKLSEWRLADSQRMLKLVIDHIPQRVFWKDTELNYLGCNQAFCRDAGLEQPEEIIGKNDFELAWRANAEAYRRDDLETMRLSQARINYEEVQQRDDGSESWLRTSKIPLSDMDGRTVGLLGLYEDITERKLLERQLRELAHYDSLTGLANRTFFYHHLERVTSRIQRRRMLAALLYLDLDKFKSINDTHGHDMGDAVLKAFAQRLKSHLRDSDLAVRLGGDEFAVLLEDLPDRAAAECVARKLVASMQAPLLAGKTEILSGTSIGIAFLGTGMAGDEVVRRADQAMYRAKREGRNRYAVGGDTS
jgi:diguanylate cyclase (GGDEF)-like protein/PAS domain S-box-containing protein